MPIHTEKGLNIYYHFFADDDELGDAVTGTSTAAVESRKPLLGGTATQASEELESATSRRNIENAQTERLGGIASVARADGGLKLASTGSGLASAHPQDKGLLMAPTHLPGITARAVPAQQSPRSPVETPERGGGTYVGGVVTSIDRQLVVGRPPAQASLPESATLGSSSAPPAAQQKPPASPQQSRRRPSPDLSPMLTAAAAIRAQRRDRKPLLLHPGPNVPLPGLTHDLLDEILSAAQE